MAEIRDLLRFPKDRFQHYCGDYEPKLGDNCQFCQLVNLTNVSFVNS
jgi:hypothetical protein